MGIGTDMRGYAEFVSIVQINLLTALGMLKKPSLAKFWRSTDRNSYSMLLIVAFNLYMRTMNAKSAE